MQSHATENSTFYVIKCISTTIRKSYNFNSFNNFHKFYKFLSGFYSMIILKFSVVGVDSVTTLDETIVYVGKY
ncbi:unnamed protein product [Rhizophagus irregularis]|nr:unnamed protein product [Rhizophagus irregularis]